MGGIGSYLSNAKIDYACDAPKLRVMARGKKHSGLFKHLFQSYGNITSVLAVSDLLLKGYQKNKYYRFFKESIPVGLFLYDLGVKINDFYRGLYREL